MLASVKNHMLPHFIREQNRIMLYTKAGEQFEVFARQNHSRGVDRIV